MRKCPICAEEIQNEAIKCKHCGEWLRDTDSAINTPQPTTINKTPVKKPEYAPLQLTDIGTGKLILFIATLSVMPLICDLITAFTVKGLDSEIGENAYKLVIYILYMCLGVWIADYIYKFKRAFLMIGISSVGFFIIRMVLISLYRPEYISEVLSNSIIQMLAINVTASLLIYILRRYDTKFDYAYVNNVYESMHPITGKREDTGTCSKCNQITTTAKQGIIKLFGKRAVYTCNCCGRFLSGSPLNSSILGVTEIMVCIIFLIGTAHNMKDSSSNNGLITLFYLVGIFDGLKRIIHSVSSIFAKPMPQQEFKIDKPEYVTCEKCNKECYKNDTIDNLCQSCQLL